MRLLAAVFFAAATFGATPALAQAGWGMSEPIAGQVGELGRLNPNHRYWADCRDVSARVAVHGCGRVIGARISSAYTASAHYFRSIALSSLGENERARRDLNRAYVLFADAVGADESDAIALYGRGITLIRLGHRNHGEADIARANTLSDGVGHFFDAERSNQ